MTKCFICGARNNLHIHEIYYGTANRKKSIEYGCYVSLCAYHHNMSDYGVHYNKALDLNLKQKCQRRFEEIYDNAKFMETFNKNYL